MQYVEVAVDDAGQRLDNFLVRFLKDVPRTHIFRLLRKGEVRVNKKRAKPDQRVVVGDQVRIPPLRRAEAMPAPTEPRPASASLQKLVLDAIIYEDNDLIVFNKPSGIAVHGGSATDFGLIEALRSARPELVDAELVHRLDRDTSGCLLVAKRRGALRDLHLQLREGTHRKALPGLAVREMESRHQAHRSSRSTPTSGAAASGTWRCGRTARRP